MEVTKYCTIPYTIQAWYGYYSSGRRYNILFAWPHQCLYDTMHLILTPKSELPPGEWLEI